MKTARDLLQRLYKDVTTELACPPKREYLGLHVLFKSNITSGTSRLLIVVRDPNDGAQAYKRFPMDTSILELAKYITTCINNLCNPRFKITVTEVFNDLLDKNKEQPCSTFEILKTE